MRYEPPEIGKIIAQVFQQQNCNIFWVTVKEFKFDTIRQEAYWVVKGVKQFKSEQKANEYVKRIIGE